MAGKTDVTKVMVRVEDEESWTQLMQESENKLVVVDIHQDWCGNCEAILPTMSRLYVDYDSCKDRFQYATANSSKLETTISEALKQQDAKIDLKAQGCLPLFGVFKKGSCVATVKGVDSPNLLNQISTYMPEKKAPTEEQ